MLRITVDLVPFGVENEKAQIAELEIWREHPQATPVSLYSYRMVEGGKLVISGTGVPHERSRGVFKLIEVVLADAYAGGPPQVIGIE